MKYILRLLVFLMMGSAYAQSNLPACAGHDVSKWSDCYGTAIYTEANRSKFKYFIYNEKINENPDIKRANW